MPFTLCVSVVFIMAWCFSILAVSLLPKAEEKREDIFRNAKSRYYSDVAWYGYRFPMHPIASRRCESYFIAVIDFLVIEEITFTWEIGIHVNGKRALHSMGCITNVAHTDVGQIIHIFWRQSEISHRIEQLISMLAKHVIKCDSTNVLIVYETIRMSRHRRHSTSKHGMTYRMR